MQLFAMVRLLFRFFYFPVQLSNLLIEELDLLILLGYFCHMFGLHSNILVLSLFLRPF